MEWNLRSENAKKWKKRKTKIEKKPAFSPAERVSSTTQFGLCDTRLTAYFFRLSVISGYPLSVNSVGRLPGSPMTNFSVSPSKS